MNMQNNPVQASAIGTNKIVTNDIPYFPLKAASGVASLNTLMQGMYGAGSSSSPSVLNFFGFNSASLSAKLLMMLRYGNFVSDDTDSSVYGRSYGLSTNPDFSLVAYNSNLALNALPLAVYQKIYADHFRISQWEKNEPYTYNFDWYSGGNIFSSLTDSSNRRNAEHNP
jgi:hypothetical protein